MRMFLSCIALALLIGCASTTPGTIAPTPAQQIQSGLLTIQPVASEAACAGQSLANLDAQSATQLGASGALKGGAAATVSTIALGAAVGSAILGTFCDGLPVGAPLPTPVAVVPGASTTVQGVTVPVPVNAVSGS